MGQSKNQDITFSLGLLKFYLNHTSDVHSFISQPATFLFNDSNHLLLQSKKNWSVFEFRELKSRRIYARISFNIKSHEAYSPRRAPFGSLEVYRQMNEFQVREFLEKVLFELKALGVKKVVIRSFPEVYDELLSHTINMAMRSLQFISHEEISSVIPVDEKLFDRKIKVSERQKLKKATQLFQMMQSDFAELNKIYSFIADCRKERNQSLSMTVLKLRKTLAVFPDSFYLFKVIKKNEIAAAAIVIRVSKEILYTFYYAHAKRHNPVSPVVYLVSGIYDFAKSNKFKMIDLGTSMVDGHINRSLLHFKKSIGGISTQKVTYTKHL